MPMLEPTPDDVLDELNKLRLTLDRVKAKSKRRRKAIKDMQHALTSKDALIRHLLLRNGSLHKDIKTIRQEWDETLLELSEERNK